MIDRKLSQIISQRLGKGKAIIVYGPRQSGKTTLMRQIIRDNSLDMLVLNGDDDNDATLFGKVTAQQWTQIIGSHKGVFVDEAQKIKNVGRAVKLLIDSRPNLDVLITGSSSFGIANETEEPLTGRKYEYRLFPLSFGECAATNGIYGEKKNLPLRLLFGAYPEVVTTDDDKKEILKQLAESYLFRDLLLYDGIRKFQK